MRALFSVLLVAGSFLTSHPVAAQVPIVLADTTFPAAPLPANERRP